MPEAEQFRIGAVVRCNSGEVCGQVRYLDIDPRVHALTHLAVEQKGRQGLGRLVPIGQAHASRHTREIQFHGSLADFRKLAASDVTEFAPDTEGYELHGPEQVVEEPEDNPIRGEQAVGSTVPGFSETETFDNVPDGEVQIPSGDVRRGHNFHIHAGSHEFGRVHGVLVDAGHRVTHVLLGEWHGLHHEEVAVPFADLDTVEDDGFHLSMSKQEIEALPPLGSDHPSV
ncbi:MAG TPA: hypothetical protein VEG33_06125 [Streptosporangiaceae bacterium]|nr:hypothetical protein [Streptosporangiaceae bacterium]